MTTENYLMVLQDLKGLPFLEEAEIYLSEQNGCASSRKDPCQPPEFLKSLFNLPCTKPHLKLWIELYTIIMNGNVISEP